MEGHGDPQLSLRQEIPMSSFSRLASLASVVVLTLSVDACRRQQVGVAGSRTSTSVDTSFRQGSTRDSLAERIRQQAIDDSIRAARAGGARDADLLRNALREVMHFDFDESDLRDDARARLDAKLPIM